MLIFSKNIFFTGKNTKIRLIKKRQLFRFSKADAILKCVRYILAQKSSCTSISQVSHLMSYRCLIKLKAFRCTLRCLPILVGFSGLSLLWVLRKYRQNMVTPLIFNLHDLVKLTNQPANVTQ